MNWFSILAQIVVLFWGVYAMTQKSRRNMAIQLLILNALNCIMYLVSADYSAMALMAVTTLRCFLYTYKEKCKTNLLFYLCLSMHLVCSVCSYQSWQSLFSITACLMTCFSLWFCKPQTIRLVCAGTDALWLVYNLLGGRYIKSAESLFGVTSKVYLYLRERRKTVKMPAMKQ